MRPPRTEHAVIPAGRPRRPAWSTLPEPTPVIRSARYGKETFLTGHKPPNIASQTHLVVRCSTVQQLPQVTGLPPSLVIVQDLALSRPE